MATLSSLKRPLLTLAIAMAFLALLFGAWFGYNLHKKQNVEFATATILPQAKTISSFQLIDDNEHAFTNDNLKGHWSLVFFGFTSCPDLCPTTLTTLNAAYQKLEAAHQAPMPQVVFISVDPERDTPPHLNDYMSSFNKNFIGATGTKEQIDKLTQELSVLYMKVTQANSDSYTIDHSGTILVIDPAGNWYALFNTPHDANNIAKDFQAIVSQYNSKNPLAKT